MLSEVKKTKSCMKQYFCFKLQLITSFLLAFFLEVQPACQAQSDDTNEEKPIEFSFTSKRFDKVLPFDQFFSILVKDIPDSINSITIKIFEYDLKNLKFVKGSVITPDSLAKSRVTFETEEWQRIMGSKESSAEISVPYMLKPNRKFIIGVVGRQKRNLTKDEKSELITELSNNNEIINLINKVCQDFLTSEFLTKVEGLNFAKAEFNEIAKRVVLTVNRDYVVNSIDSAQIRKLGGLVVSMANLKNALNSLEKSSNVKNNPKNTNILKEIKNFREQLKQINWGSVKETDPDFEKLKTIKDSIFVQFSGKPLKSTESKRKSIDNFILTVLSLRPSTDWINNIATKTIANNTFKLSTTDATYRADFVKNASLYITLDVGTAYVWRMDRVLAYSGVNIYFRPVNKNIPLRTYRGWDYIGVRTSLLLGVTMSSVEKTDVRKGLLGNLAMVLGVGFRAVPFLKLNGGCMIYYTYSTNPLVSRDRYQTTFSPFVSLSIDLDVKPLFKGIGESVFK
jgi:hypothetical protein